MSSSSDDWRGHAGERKGFKTTLNNKRSSEKSLHKESLSLRGNSGLGLVYNGAVTPGRNGPLSVKSRAQFVFPHLRGHILLLAQRLLPSIKHTTASLPPSFSKRTSKNGALFCCVRSVNHGDRRPLEWLSTEQQGRAARGGKSLVGAKELRLLSNPPPPPLLPLL